MDKLKSVSKPFTFCWWREGAVQLLLLRQGHAPLQQVQGPLTGHAVPVRQPVLNHPPELEAQARVGLTGGGVRAARVQQVVWHGCHAQQGPLCDHRCAVSAVPAAQVLQDRPEDALFPGPAAAAQQREEQPDRDPAEPRIREAFHAGHGSGHGAECELLIRWQSWTQGSHDFTGHLHTELPRLLLWPLQTRQHVPSHPPRYSLVTQRDAGAQKPAGSGRALPAAPRGFTGFLCGYSAEERQTLRPDNWLDFTLNVSSLLGCKPRRVRVLQEWTETGDDSRQRLDPLRPRTRLARPGQGLEEAVIVWRAGEKRVYQHWRHDRAATQRATGNRLHCQRPWATRFTHECKLPPTSTQSLARVGNKLER